MPIAFMCRAKPKDCDALEIFRQAKRMFIGWPLFAAGRDYDPRRLQSCMVSLTIGDDEWAEIAANNPNFNARQHNRHRNFARRVTPGSIAVVPRRNRDAAWIARITGGYHIVDSPDWAADYLAVRRIQGLDAHDNRNRHIADVAQGWRIDKYRQVALSGIPEALRHTLGIPSTFAVFDSRDPNLNAHAALTELIGAN